MKDLTVFVLTHNRGVLLLETINSILNQTCHDFKFVVSDNSSDDSTKQLLIQNNLIGKFDYRKRDREYSSLDHFNLCLSEVDTSYFVLFHDDDIMFPEYVETMYNEISNGDYVAVGCNAYYLMDTTKTKKRMFKSRNNYIISEKKMLAEQYCKGNIVPYPSYMYSKRKLLDLKFHNDVGKYSDVTWLLNVLEKGKFLWISSPLMYYRSHCGQDSQDFDYRNQLKLVKKLFKFCDEKTIRKYREQILYVMICRDLRQYKGGIPKRLSMIRYFFKIDSLLFFIKLVIKYTRRICFSSKGF